MSTAIPDDLSGRSKAKKKPRLKSYMVSVSSRQMFDIATVFFRATLKIALVA